MTGTWRLGSTCCAPLPTVLWWPEQEVHVALRRDEQYEGFSWLLDAACKGEHTAAFFPPAHFERKELRLARERHAKAICAQCAVASECLDYALRTREPHGVWGGLNEVERRQLIEGHVPGAKPVAAPERRGGRPAHLAAGASSSAPRRG